MHSCGGKYLQFKNEKTKIEYVVCEKCYEAYLTSHIKMFCTECNEEYYSSIFGENYNLNLQLVTWYKYHCNAVINDCIKCPKCKYKLFLNLKENILICNNCDFKSNPDDMNYQCLVCKKDFKANLKIYNSIEFDIIKISIKNALLYKLERKPNTLPCCKKDVKNLDFFHKKECAGKLYSGYWNSNNIIVCSKCRMLSEIDKFIWTCPLCYQRFKIKNIENVNKKEIENISNNLSKININNQDKINLNPASTNNNININISPNPTIDLNFFMKNKNFENNLNILKKDPKLQQHILPNTNFDIENIPISKRKYTADIKPLPPTTSNNSANNLLITSPNLRNFHLARNDEKEPRYEKSTNDLRNISKILNHSKSLNKRSEISPNDRNISNIPYDYKNHNKTPDKKENSGNLGGSKNYKPLESKNKNNNIDELDKNNSEINYDTKEDENLKNFECEDFKIISQIGQGSFGKIYLVEDKQKRFFSMKKIIANDDIELENFTQEYELVNKVRHKNILRIHSICRRKLDATTHALYILMEKGVTDWDKEIKVRQNQKKFYSEKELFNILGQLTDALGFLQVKNISHRDIKPQNVLLFKDGIFKIADFGEAKKISIMETNKQLSTLRGTELYMSPLLFNGLRLNQNDIKHNSYKSDVFSLGFCFLYAATLNIHSLYELRRETDNFNIGIKIEHFVKNRYSGNLKSILIKMLEINETKRYDLLELRNALNTLNI